MLRRQAFQVDLAKRYYYDLPEEQHDVHINLIDLEKVKYGQPYKVRIVLEVSCANDFSYKPPLTDFVQYSMFLQSFNSIWYFSTDHDPIFQNKSRQIRTLKAVVTTASVYYTGIPANPIKRADGEFALAGGQSETLALQVHPEEYMDQVWPLSHFSVFFSVKYH